MRFNDDIRLNRRVLLQSAGLSVASAALLAACGGDDEDPTATAGTNQPTATSEPATAAMTEASDGPTATGEMIEPSPTSGEAEATTTEEEAATPAPGGTFVEGGDPLMGQEFEPGTPGGILIDGDTCCVTAPFNIGEILGRDNDYSRLVFEPLVEINPFTLEPVGCLAEAWEVGDDSVTWTFFLREGVLFHDGAPLTAADVTATYALLSDPASGSIVVSQIEENISSITAVDERTVAFTTPEVLPDFVFDGAGFVIGAVHVLSEIDPAEYAASDAATGADPAMVVGTGPFRVKEVVTDDHVTLSRFDDYWDGAPYLDEWTFRVLGDDAALLTSLLSGEVDYVRHVNNAYIGQLEEAGLQLLPWQTRSFDLLPLNLANPLFQDKRVRQALMYALDREAMLQVAYEGVGQVAETLLAPYLPFANPEGVTVRYGYDPDMANQLLDEAGWEARSDGIREKDGERFAFTILGEAGWQPWESQVIAAQEYWRQVGLEVTVELLPASTLSEQYAAGDYDATITFFVAAPTPDQSPNYLCDSPSNYTGYCNEEVDAILTEARSELDEARRIELYTQFQNIVLDELPILPTIFYGGYSVAAARVHNPPATEIFMNKLFAGEKIWVDS
jgi:peptide/nickel transport system substrate-binding protein